MPDPTDRPRHDPSLGRFIIDLEAGQAFLQYGDRGPSMVEFSYTFVPPVARNAGIGALLVHHAVAWAHAQGRSIDPTCGYVRTVMERDGLPTVPPGRDGPETRGPA